jgi:aspartyl-tRNA(Asn)/glutamyl-tRNA(Gln) amidotransferase subunit B
MMKPEFESDVIIGLEVHVELDTKTKLFCACPTKGTEVPNSRCCEICLGHPGSKPVFNKKVLEYALRLCLGLKCEISKELVFSRKSYFYPDMSKNYQISQYEMPLGKNGILYLSSGKKVKIRRAHIEEDPAALVHPDGMLGSRYVLVDYNRSGNPLCEVVTEPVLTSPEDAREFMKQLIIILEYLEIFDIKDGIIKADANISIKKTKYRRVEIKNISGFKEIERALIYELERQISHPEEVVKETRSWEADIGITRSIRKKEVEEEYGYIVDPDLVVIDILDEHIKKTRSQLPELPFEKAGRFVKEYGVSKLDAEAINSDKEFSLLFERLVKKFSPEIVGKWLRVELMRALNLNKKTLKEVHLEDKHLIELVTLMRDKVITDSTAKQLLEKLVVKPFSPKEYVSSKNIHAVHDQSQIRAWCEEAINENPQALKDYTNGKEKAKQFFVGQVIKKSKGLANQDIVNSIINEIIKSRAK